MVFHNLTERLFAILQVFPDRRRGRIVQTHAFDRWFFLLLLLLTLVSFAQAGDVPRYAIGGDVIHGGSVDFAKAGADSINLMSTRHDPTNGPGEPYYFGDFEDVQGNPDWNGWTHHDISVSTENYWTVSTYNQPNPANHAAWCGDINLPSCGGTDPEGGYGNNWEQTIEFRRTIPHPGISSTVTVTATLIHDSEPGCDYTYLSYQYKDQNIFNMRSWDGAGTVDVSESVSYQPENYMDGTDIVVYFRFQSDGAWSDEDCSFPSAGGCQVDDINVHIVNGAYDENFLEDFEHGGVADDLGIWDIVLPIGVGDFAKIWTNLGDLDPCVSNFTPQVAFIDDGIVVPGTGGSHCINWCYGPGGYIVTTTGGLAGPDYNIHNVIESPVMDWPGPKSGTGPDDDGIILSFGVFRHQDLSMDSPWIYDIWGIRSADTDNSAGNGFQDITEQPWENRAFVDWGGPDYLRSEWNVSDLMNPGRDKVQVRLGVYEIGNVWGVVTDDGYPAPYFDNVTVKIFPYIGPGMAARELDLAQDNFPERGTIDMKDPGSHSVRFDMAKNISLPSHLCNDPGDSLVVDIVALRAGAGLDGDPELHYIVDRNPVFDPYRTSGLPAIGSVTGLPAVGATGQPTPDRWAFDLPDTGFLFPGDVLHYYISGTDAIGGVGGTDPQISLMPADTTGFSTGFGDPMGYNSTFVVRALPSIREDLSGGYEQPGILFINDFGDRGGEVEWYTALSNLGLVVDEDYDVYYVNDPRAGVGNGIGGRADHLMLQDYDDILYTCGNLSKYTISNGSFENDAGDDVGTLTNWLDIGGKDMFLTGDDLASDMSESGAGTLTFLHDFMGVTLVTNSVGPEIDNQVAPLVEIIEDNPVFVDVLQTWVAYGGCAAINNFDGVETSGAGLRLAEFLNPPGQSGQYTFSAATLNIMNPGAAESRTISMPVDLMFVYPDPGSPPGPLSGRDQLLKEILVFFEAIPGPASDVAPGLPGITFQASSFPNPFNPSTTIKYSMPRAGHLKLSVYNVRGQLVKTLIDGGRPAGADQTIMWDGTDNRGTSAASGLYFYEARAAGEVLIGKMTLLK